MVHEQDSTMSTINWWRLTTVIARKEGLTEVSEVVVVTKLTRRHRRNAEVVRAAQV
jgi:hypothetical protein